MSLFSAIGVSASGMEAQRKRAELITENLANAETTRTPDGGPYRRKDAVFTTAPAGDSFAGILEASGSPVLGVRVSDVTIDDRDPEKRYLPGHPDAEPEGYVACPRIDPATEMVVLLGASRGYQANVAAISAVKDMMSKSIDLFR